MSEIITIKKSEYDKLKKYEEIDMDLFEQFKNSLEDIKTGKLIRC